MLKYINYQVTFSEVPNEISLCINITNCPCHCKGCHSPYLAEDIGEELSRDSLINLIRRNEGITCVCFMGGDSNPADINYLARLIKLLSWSKLKVAWYSGRSWLPPEIYLPWFDYIKLGQYIEELGPLNKPTTNQRFYKIEKNKLVDITNLFWKDND